MKDKVILITGSSKGLGASLVKLFSLDNKVIINYNTNDVLANNLGKLTNSLVIKCDITNNLEVDNMIDIIIKKYGHIDILINNACYCNDLEIEDKTKEDFIKCLDVNLVSPFELIKKVNKHMNNGTIINICSTDGIDTFNPLSVDYCASKAGLINMTKNLSLILNNRIIGIAPNYINTESVLEMNPDYLKSELKRIGQKELIDKDLLSCKIKEIIESDIVSGTIVRIDDNE